MDWWIANQWEFFKIKEGKSGLEAPRYNKDGELLVVDMSNKWAKMRKSSELKEMYIVRYADDFKIFCRDYITAVKVMEATKQWLSSNLHLEVSDEKSGITNLRKNYTTFLGIKFKAVPKGERWIVRSHIADKSRHNAEEKLRSVWKDIRNPSLQMDLHENIKKYNSIVMGLHNYFCMATMVSADFADISYKVVRTRNGVNHNRRCIPLESKGEFQSKVLFERYGASSQCRWMKGRVILPIGYVQYVYPKYKRREVNKYARKYSDAVNCISFEVMKHMVEHAEDYPTLEMADNAVSRYIAQKGKCAVTHEALTIQDMVCHHIKENKGERNDTYRNLTLLSGDVSRLILSTDPDKIREFILKLQLTEEMREKVNKLRKHREIQEIQFEDYIDTKS